MYMYMYIHVQSCTCYKLHVLSKKLRCVVCLFGATLSVEHTSAHAVLVKHLNQPAIAGRYSATHWRASPLTGDRDDALDVENFLQYLVCMASLLSAVVPPGWLRSIRLERGRETRMVSSVVFDDEDDGDELGPGDTLVLKLPVRPHDELHYRITVDDDLDVGFALSLDDGKGSPTLVEAPHLIIDHEATLEVGKDGVALLTLDNSHAWFSSKMVHVAVECRSGRADLPACAAATSAAHRSEEDELRRSYLDTLRTEEEQLERRAARLRRQLATAEMELERVRKVRQAELEREERSATSAPASTRALATALATSAGASSVASPPKAAAAVDHAGGAAEATSAADQAAAAATPETVLWAVWRRLALLDSDVRLEARWVAQESAEALTPPSATPETEGMRRDAEVSPPLCLLLHAVQMHGRLLLGVGAVLQPHADVSRLLELCIERIATAPLAPWPMPKLADAEGWEEGSEEGTEEGTEEAEDGRGVIPRQASGSTAAVAPNAAESEPASRRAEPSTQAAATDAEGPPPPPAEDAENPAVRAQPAPPSAPPAPPAPHRARGADDGSALDRLQLLSSLLLEIDPTASMDVSMVTHGAFAIHSLTLRGRVLEGGFGDVTAATDVRTIVEALKQATDAHGLTP